MSSLEEMAYEALEEALYQIDDAGRMLDEESFGADALKPLHKAIKLIESVMPDA